MPTLFIDGMKLDAREGQTLLELALEHDIYIPHLCYHPDLTPAGACRLCVVELEGRGLVASCQAAAEEGLKVRTESPLVTRTRQIALELMLTNHRGDCLSCDKNNDCVLQRVAAHVGIDEDRFKQLRLLTPNFPIDESNPFFLRDPNRCVLCGICVRTCSEIQGIAAVNYAFSGYATTISAPGGRPIAESICQSCGECVSRCPTGALLPKRYRRPSREVKTTCVYCGVGCSLYLGVRGDEVVFARGDREGPVNHGSLCVKGRFGNSFINSPDRLKTPLIKRDGEFVEASWDEALDLVASKFQQFRGDRFAAIGSSRCTNEENFVVQKFARAVMATNNVDNCARLCHAPTVTGLSKAFGTGGGTNPLADIDGASCIFVIGSNSPSAHPVAGARIRRAASHATLIVADPRKIELCKHADVWLPLRAGSDVALLMGMARVILSENLHDSAFIAERCENFDAFTKALEAFDLATVERITGVPREKIVTAARLYATHKPALITYSLGITEHTHGTDNVLALANLAMLTGNIGKPSAGIMPMRGQNNVQGACDMGCIPGAYSGYQSVTNAEIRGKFEQAWGVPLPDQPGLSIVEYFQALAKGSIEALYVVGMDPAFTVADVTQVQDALRSAEFVVFQDIFLTGSAEFADVVLPAASFAEKDGTFTNLERRLQRVRKAIEPVGDSRPDWWITSEIARRMGAKGFDYTSPSEILDEIAELTPSFRGLSFARLEDGSIQWPCPAVDHPGTPRLHVDTFNTPSGKGYLSALEYRPPAEEADDEYPFILTTGRSLFHFHLAMTCKVPGLMALHPEESVWINPADADRLHISSGDWVTVASRRGELRVKARVTDEVSPGAAFMTFHFYETPTNVLTQQALDPVAKTPEFKVTAIRIEKAE